MKILLFLSVLISPYVSYATSSDAYMARFDTFIKWHQNLPEQPEQDFLNFIDNDTPLAKKLREKWLYQLAKQKDWLNYRLNYKQTDDVNLQCFYHLANYYQGINDTVFSAAKKLWLTGDSQPAACNKLFGLLLKNENFDQNLIKDRIILALDKHNLPLVRYLLKQYKVPRLKDEQQLITIYQNPLRIQQLPFNDLYSHFYLFGLKRMVSLNMPQAFKIWAKVQNSNVLSNDQKQAFLAHVALYKAMRNQEDTWEWFTKIQPTHYNDVLLDWQIRFALKHKQWKQVVALINYFQDQQNPCWQYWSARAKEAMGQLTQAKDIYQELAKSRQYYGFLASLRLNKKLSFENENPISDKTILKPYGPFIDKVKLLYQNHQTLEASRLLNDFVSELPKEEKSALLSWVANELQWHGKSVALSNTQELNNQLSLRFPIPYNSTINSYAKSYQVPQEFIYAIIRQESGFRDDAVSQAGARGLMQVMPATASSVAKQARIDYKDKNQLFSKEKNLNIGVAYIKHLSKRFNDHPALIAAAYNAGPRQVNYWLKNHPANEMDIWIETLPWRETRNYLKNVIAFYAVYQYRMQHKPNIGSFLKPL
ncbi:transglycosylase SLT domain-containing protein [Legionella gresilensis]|uniref:transglycosylase SLT domain-containing protein n=1 Tax=Legionella gresilensis TaxID=91823 RepID=UPI0013EF714D|nr:transglycosylase SLT domain-containing protein [Legionella gresilensis]